MLGHKGWNDFFFQIAASSLRQLSIESLPAEAASAHAVTATVARSIVFNIDFNIVNSPFHCC
jgi:hypothetical protein